MTRHLIQFGCWLLFAGVLTLGCSVSTEPSEDSISYPHVRSISPNSAKLGTPIRVMGENFPDKSVGQLQMVLRGDFIAENGQVTPVDKVVNLTRKSDTEATWGGLGPAKTPFGRDIGEFVGTAAARVVQRDATELNDPSPVQANLKIQPSIRVSQFLPRHIPNDDGQGMCGDWVKRAFENVEYIMRVEAIGFQPVRFDYTVTAPALEQEIGYQPLQFTDTVSGPYHSLGTNGGLRLWPVPERFVSYAAVFQITATDISGKTIGSTFSVGVKRLVDPIYNGNLFVAEILRPINASGCMYGGVNNRQVTYGDSFSETRRRATSISWNESWAASHTVSTSEQIGTVQTTSTGDAVARTTGGEFVTKNGNDVTGGAGVWIVEAGWTRSRGDEDKTVDTTVNSTSNMDSVSESEVTTDTVSDVESRSIENGAAVVNEVSSTTQVNKSYGGEIIAYTYGVFFLQPVRLVQKATLVIYNMCGNVEDTAGDMMLDNWTWNISLAMNDSCYDSINYELMDSELPKPVCLIPPCVEQ